MHFLHLAVFISGHHALVVDRVYGATRRVVDNCVDKTSWKFIQLFICDNFHLLLYFIIYAPHSHLQSTPSELHSLRFFFLSRFESHLVYTRNFSVHSCHDRMHWIPPPFSVPCATSDRAAVRSLVSSFERPTQVFAAVRRKTGISITNRSAPAHNMYVRPLHFRMRPCFCSRNITDWWRLVFISFIFFERRFPSKDKHNTHTHTVALCQCPMWCARKIENLFFFLLLIKWLNRATPHG